MIFLSLLCAFLLEQARPLGHPNAAVRWVERFADRVARHCNAGQPSNALFGWCVVMLTICAGVAAVDWVLSSLAAPLGWLWAILVYYFAIGFRQVTQHLADMVVALKAGDADGARRQLAQWRPDAPADLGEADVVRLAIEEGLRGAHRFIFGPMLLALLFGPVGAGLYAGSAVLMQRWGRTSQTEMRHFAEFTRRLHGWIDWLPARVTAAGFAIAGNFEDAFYCWRNQAAAWPDRFSGVILASGAGAIGVRLGGPLRHLTHIEERPELGLGEEPDVDAMESTVSMLWRATVIWLIAILVIGVARLTS